MINSDTLRGCSRGVHEHPKACLQLEAQDTPIYVLTFQPVTLKVFPALPMVIVLSHIPGSEPDKNENASLHAIRTLTIYNSFKTRKARIQELM